MTLDERPRFITSVTPHTSNSGYRSACNFESKSYDEQHSNWPRLHGKKNAAMDTAIRLLVAFVAALTLIVLIAVFGVWTSAASIGAAVRRKSRSVKEPSDWFVISGS